MHGATMSTAVITIGIDPYIHLGPLSIAWHGVTIAIGIAVGALFAARFARERGISVEPLYGIVLMLTIGALVGGRIFYLLEHDPGGIVRPDRLLGSHGFTFDGGVILAVVLIVAYVLRRGLSAAYLDVVAAGLGIGIAVGRIGDIINGEHYGPRSDFFLAVRNSNPNALTPNPHFAYHNGGLYESLLGLLIFAIVWPLRHRLRRPLELTWLVMTLFAAGRLVEFFYRLDSPQLALGLNNAQWSSIGLLVVCAVGWPLTARLARRHRAAQTASKTPTIAP